HIEMGTAFLYNEPEYGLYADLNRDCILDQIESIW
ncbi:hypothetical protein Q604_UNBC04349G0002, partial [human gut metagenome]